MLAAKATTSPHSNPLSSHTVTGVICCYTRSLKLLPGLKVLATLMDQDLDQDGLLDFHEFVMMTMAGSHSEAIGNQVRAQLAEMRELFSLMDPDGDGGISSSEIWEALTGLVGLEVDYEVVDQMCVAADEDGNGELDFCEFARMMALSRITVEHEEPPPTPDARAIEELLKIRPVMRSRELCGQIARLLKKVTGALPNSWNLAHTLQPAVSQGACDQYLTCGCIH